MFPKWCCTHYWSKQGVSSITAARRWPCNRLGMPFVQCEQKRKAAIAKLAIIVKHCDALEADADLCVVGKNRVELVKILAVDCAEIILSCGPREEKVCV